MWGAGHPELRGILVEAFEPGATLIVPMAARLGVNLGTHLERIIAKAGHKSWPRLFQNLRASCETDCGREMAATGCARPPLSTAHPRAAPTYDAKCDARSSDKQLIASREVTGLAQQLDSLPPEVLTAARMLFTVPAQRR